MACPNCGYDGPPIAHTGGFGEPTCRVCHQGQPLNAAGGTLRVEGLPGRYEAGRTYELVKAASSCRKQEGA